MRWTLGLVGRVTAENAGWEQKLLIPPAFWMMGHAASHSLLYGAALARVAEVASIRSDCQRLNFKREVRVGLRMSILCARMISFLYYRGNLGG